ncbi:MAG: SNF2-related protein [candidate division KSB1 bacterium]
MLITNGEILGLATQDTYRRGLKYYQEGRVDLVALENDFFSAKILGRPVHEIVVHRTDNRFVTRCNCRTRAICEHVIAALLEAKDQYTKPKRKKAAPNGVSSPEVNHGPENGWRQFVTTVHYSDNATAFATSKPNKEGAEWQLYFMLALKNSEWFIVPYRTRLRKDGSYGMSYPTSSRELPFYDIVCSQKESLALIMLEGVENSNRKVSPFAAGLVPNTGYHLKYGASFGMLFDLLRDSKFYLAADTEYKHALQAEPATVRFEIHMREENETIALFPVLIKNKTLLPFDFEVHVLTTQPTWLVRRHEFLKLENNPPVDLLLSLQAWEKNLNVPKAELKDFFVEMERLPGLLSHLVLPNQSQLPLIDGFSRKHLEVIEHEEALTIKLGFVYGNKTLPCLPPDQSLQSEPEQVQHRADLDFVRVRRDLSAEAQARDQILATGAKQNPSGEFVLRDVNVIDWLLRELPKLTEQDFEVCGENSLQRFRVNRAQPTLRMSVSTEIDWFDCRLLVDFDGIALSLKELRKALLHRSKYVQLSDGSTGIIPDEWQQQLAHLLHLGELAGESVKVSRHHVTLIDMLFDALELKQADRGFRDCLTRLENFNGIHAVPVPEKFQGTLRPYQARGLDWLYFLKEYRFGGCLADDMGLGKTVQTLALLQNEKNLGTQLPSLIVCPTSVIFNWENEFKRFTPELKIIAHTGLERRRDPNFEACDVIMTSYGILRRDIEFLKDAKLHYLILDESQHIKNSAAQTAKAVRLLQAEHRLALTGTPVENNTHELWSQFNFLNPGLLGSLNYFNETFTKPIERDRDEASAAMLRKMIFPFILRRTKNEVERDLPEKSENLFHCKMLKEQRKLYEHWRDYYRAHVLQQIDLKGLDKSRMYVLEGLTRLRQICCHPHLVDKDAAPDSGKFEAFWEMLQEIVAEKHKVLVFSQFVRMLKIIARQLDGHRIPYCYLDGHTRDRKTPVEKFQSDPEQKVFLISLKAGGFGLNLTAADYVVIYDPWWNPAAEAQAIDRTHRIGQDKRVFAYKMIVRDSVEEKILQLQERKKALISDLISTDAGLFKQLTVDDIGGLFS